MTQVIRSKPKDVFSSLEMSQENRLIAMQLQMAKFYLLIIESYLLIIVSNWEGLRGALVNCACIK